MSMHGSLHFTFNGESSRQYGVVLATIGGGLLSEPFLPNTSLLEERIRGRHHVYPTGTAYDPLEFTLSLAFEEEASPERLRRLAAWLRSSRYAPLVFEDKPTHVYWCQPVKDAAFQHNGRGSGYVTVSFRCNAPWAFTPVYTQARQFADNTVQGTDYVFENNGDAAVFPIMAVHLLEGSGFKLVNTSNKGEYFELQDLAPDEKLVIDHETKDIRSDLPQVYRYRNRTAGSRFMRMLPGANHLKIYGHIQLTMTCQAPLLG
ncbi:phage tail family protein [Paenibacillus sp. IB182496]|uniref:Phage tail family protein n=1 Tax=Paenibacillus sabuli TaxID=2772509 RepID=A0A927BUA4_9BACL|nr:distal tail protein Dit [Paenibacillus sabuli]MBD2846442.1 phage tail family protein [Paenibacillus sabuli]